MRVGPVGWLFDNEEDVRRCARATAEVTHNHPEGIKGAESVAMAIFLSRKGKSKEEIKTYLESTFGYNLHSSYKSVKEEYHYTSQCQVVIPISLMIFLNETSFMDVLRVSSSTLGDTDTIASIACSIAEAYYGVPEELKNKVRALLPKDILTINDNFEEFIRR